MYLEKCRDLINSRPEFANLEFAERADLAKALCDRMSAVFVGRAEGNDGFTDWLAAYPNVKEDFVTSNNLTDEAHKDLEALERKAMHEAFAASGLGTEIRADADRMVSAMRERGLLAEALGVKRDIPDSLRDYPENLGGFVVVYSSNGAIIAKEDGLVVALGGDWPDEPLSPLAPLKFDFEEWKRYWKEDRIPGDIDILDLGYATACGCLLPPAIDWREEIREGEPNGPSSTLDKNEETAMQNITDTQKSVVENLTPEQLEYAYRLQDRKFRAEDAERHLSVLYPDIVASQADIDELVEAFFNNQDCNISENETWVATIEDWAAAQKPSPCGC